MVSGQRFLSFTDYAAQGCAASWLPPSLEVLPAATSVARTQLEVLNKPVDGGSHKVLPETRCSQAHP